MFEIRMPKFGLSMEAGTVIKWYKNVGDQIQKGEALVEIESEKITNVIESPIDGFIKAILVQEGESKEVGAIIGYVAETKEELDKEELEQETKTETTLPQKEEETKTSHTEATTLQSGQTGFVSASPRAKALAKEYGIDISEVVGTGPNGRITEKDVLDFVEKQKQQVKKEPLSPLRKEISERLSKTYHSSVLVTNITKVDMTELLELKANTVPEVSVTAILIKCLAKVLLKYPEFNAHFDGTYLEKFSTVNIGFAVDTGIGLIVPVIKNADKLSLVELNNNLKNLTEKARTNKLTPEDVEGSHFTITNLGMMRTDIFTPVLNSEEVGILGVGRSTKELVVKDDNTTTIRTMAYFSLSYDHRIIDGAMAARFLGDLAEFIENKSLLKETLEIKF